MDMRYIYNLRIFSVETLEQQQNNVSSAESNQENVVGHNSNEGDKSDKESRLAHVKEALGLLYVNFPKAFIKEGNVKPLKIGIFNDLKGKIEGIEGLTLSKVRAALRMYTSQLRYLHSVVEGAKRIDLEGNEIEDIITSEHVEYAKGRISEINAKSKPKSQKSFKKFASKNNENGDKERAKPSVIYRKKTMKIAGDKPTAADLKQGVEVLVLSSEKKFVRGVVAKDCEKESVMITLKSGLTVNLPFDRVLLPKRNKGKN